ncbi:BspA family leucine-rich repeat surface protein [Flavobacterium branchiarum]|uniref:BspA family leucine-rich repeat surface protein n=1 Tax=Flavobacterium branchiarum TaxID=1114870 RepID=A0ABV5FS74_9FLAO|nr:BspA family leucine-rich repeat surface protein [Flavobacterium branchiarum]MDN3673462.1 BspA family leucine-rich repeat surface protein [Flavobacterium branchiarum]
MKYNYSLVLMCLMCIGIIQARIYNIDNSFLKSSPPSLAFENTSYNSGLDTDFINKKTSIKTAIPITGSKNKIVSIDPIIPGDTGNFITTWEVKAGDLTITIPTSGSGYNYNIYWSEVGNPSNQNTITNSTGDQIITFPSAGTYKVEINGDFPQFYINNYADRDKILSVEQWGTIVWRSMQSAFYGASNLNVTATDRPNLSQVTDMSSMFAASSFNSPVNNWDVSNVTNIASLFNAAFAFNQSLNNWNVSKVTDMHALFSYALAFNQDISSWDVSKVTSMYGMFFGAGAFNQNISNWNVSQVTNMGLMFNEAISFNQNLGNWNVSAVSFMNVMLDDAALSTANYDKTLAGWATQTLKTNVSLGALGLHYCNSETARQSIINNYGWSITRDSKDCTNNNPSDISLSNNSINQSAGLNATVGTLSSTDADVGDTHTYSLVTGIDDNDNASFNISGTILRANNTSTMCNSTYNIRIRTTDGYNGSYEKTFIVTVIDDVAPVPSIANLPNIEMECAVKISDIPVPVATDPCTGTVNATTNDPLEYTTTGTYTITWNYVDNNNNTSSQTQTVIVKPSALGQVTFDDVTVTYNGTEQSIAVANLPTGATVSYTIILPTETVSGNSAINAGTYPVTATITPPPTEINCDPIELQATLTILKADLTGVDFEGAHFIYDGMSHSLLATDIPTGATVIYTNNSKIEAGTYEVTVLISLPNYNDLELTATLIIDKAVAIITADDIQTYVYDGTVKNAVASLNNPEGLLVYTPQQGYIDAGTYPIEISAAETTDYLAVSKTISLVIEKADLMGIIFNGANFTYDGTPHSLAVSGLPTGATVVYTNNNQTQAGTYEVTALISLANYNDLELTATLIIDKAVAIITADDIQTYVYDGTVKNAVASLNNPEGILVYTPQQGYINAGTYPVEASTAETANYLAVSKTISLVIEKADLTGIVFNGANFTYDGTSHSLAVSDLPTGATVVYTNNNQTQTGTYQVTALISLANYNDLELTATLIIDKAVAIITADDLQTYVYDGTVKNAAASLNNPEGVLVYMPQQGYIDSGTYPIEISAAETTNYLAVSKTISLVIQKADLTGIVFNGANFTYDGMSHSLAVSGLPTGATVVYTNNNQTQAGTYQVTALVTLANYNDLELTATLIIDKANQFITFDPIPVKNFSNGSTFQLNATASSGENVYYTYSYSTPNPAATVTPAGLVQLLAPGSILITAHQDGNQNYNPAETVEQELIITSSDNSIREIIINNRVYKNPDSELHYLIDCNDNTDIVNIQVKTEIGNQVSPGLTFTIQTPRPGIYRQKIIVTAPDGSTRDYEIIIEKRFDFEDIVVSKFDNVLLVNNNPQTNGGFEFVAYEWYKNGTLISTEQYYSAGDNSSDHLGSKSVYTVRVKTKMGIWLTTCEIEISQKRSYSLKLVPNPVYSGTVLKVISDFPTEELKDLKISIYDLTGRLILEKPSNQNSTEIIIPSGLTPAVYVLRFDTGRTVKALKFLVH